MENEQEGYNFESFYNPKDFEHLSTRNYRGSQFDFDKQDNDNRQHAYYRESFEIGEIKDKPIPIKESKEESNNLQQINLTNAQTNQSFRELIDDDMTKELEEFRRNAGKNNSSFIKNNSPKNVKKDSEDINSPLTKSLTDDKGVFAEAMLNLSSYVKTST